jgi:corrinoid protein of di/trimethylamine methyltransferase
MANKEEILSGLEKAVVTGKKAESIRFANEILAQGIKPLDAIDAGLIKGMMVVGEKYAAHTIFLPQVLLAADSMYGALDILLPHIPREDAAKRVDMVIGVVEGDVHDIGKNIVKTMFTAAGFNVHDMGKDRSDEEFVKAAREHHAQVVAMSTLMTPTMDSMKASVDALVEEGVRSQVKIIIGGAPTSQEFAEEIGADMHAVNAQDAVAKIRSLLTK